MSRARRAAARRGAICGVALAMAAGAALARPFAWITNQADHSVSVIDVATDRAVATIPVDKSPAGVAAVGAIGKVFVTAPDSNAVSVIDMRERRQVA